MMNTVWSGVLDVEMFHSEVIWFITNSKDYLHDEVEKILLDDLQMDGKYANEFAAEIRKYLDEDGVLPPGETMEIRSSTGGMELFIIFDGTPKTIETEVIIHELHHATTSICKERGVDDEETEAYMQEYLYHQLKEQLAGLGKSKKS